MSLIYSPETKQLLKKIKESLPHALLLEGQNGAGLYTAADKLGGLSVAALIQPTDADGNIDTTSKGVVRLAQIHELHDLTKGKTRERRVFIIDDADHMNVQAQNAFLKLLEEPVANVHFILTAHQSHMLLPTVLSRVQRARIAPISTLESQHFIKTLGVSDPRKAQQLLFIADGKPAEIARLAADEKYFSAQASLMNDARTLISGSQAERMILISQYYSDRAKSLQLLQSAKTIASFSLTKNPSRDLISLTDRLASTYERVQANGSTRLQLTNFVIQ
jgi:replication-associated recombination protein RarA